MIQPHEQRQWQRQLGWRPQALNERRGPELLVQHLWQGWGRPWQMRQRQQVLLRQKMQQPQQALQLQHRSMQQPQQPLQARRRQVQQEQQAQSPWQQWRQSGLLQQLLSLPLVLQRQSPPPPYAQLQQQQPPAAPAAASGPYSTSLVGVHASGLPRRLGRWLRVVLLLLLFLLGSAEAWTC